MLPTLLAPGVFACLALPIIAQNDIKQATAVPSTAIGQSIETLTQPLPVPLNPSILEIEIPTTTFESASTSATTAPPLPVPLESAAESSSTAFPAPVPGDDPYVYIGCFNEPPALSSTRALGATGEYLSPTFASQEALTIPLCLGACGVALAPNGGGLYKYAGVENIRECYCGLTLSPLSKPVTEGYCSAPCAADPTTTCGGYSYLSLYQRRSTLNGTSIALPPPVSPTSSPTTTLIPNSSPSSSLTSNPNSNSKPNPRTGLTLGLTIGLSLLFTLLLLLSLLYILRHRFTSRRSHALSTTSTPPPSFLGGFSLLHPSQKRTRSRPVNAVYTSDGRRFGIVVNDAATDAETYVSPLEGEAVLARKGTRHRSTFEEWKSGVISPVKVRVPVDPEAVGRSVELDSVVSPVSVGASAMTAALSQEVQSEIKPGIVAGVGVGAGVEKRGRETPIAELADSVLPVSVDSGERQSVEFGGGGDERPELDNRELERRLKELGGLSPVSEASGLTSRSEADVNARPEEMSPR